MPPRANEKRDIRPAAPDDLVQGLLALTAARVLPLSAGDRLAGFGQPGEYILAAAARAASHPLAPPITSGCPLIGRRQRLYSPPRCSWF